MGERLLFLVPFSMLFIATGCDPGHPIITDEVSYVKSIEEWQLSRLERLKSKNGWLSLAGLFWLEEGESTFGSDSSNDIVFPDKAEGYCGTITRNGDQVFVHVNAGTEIMHEEDQVTTMELENDHSDNTTYLQQGDLAWYIIKRGEKLGIRLRDHHHPRIGELDHIPSYPISTDYVVEAILEPFPEPKTITVATPVEGISESYQCPGELHFRINREDLVLYPFTSGNGYFLVIADETSGMDTYGAGRFMYATPDSTGRIVLDFNKAYNPPCAFSPFATCPFPPKENYLPVAIEAGEKSVHLH